MTGSGVWSRVRSTAADAYTHLGRALLQRWGVADDDGIAFWHDEEPRDWYEEQEALSDDDLAEIAARAQAATPGPWHWTDDLANAYLKAQHPRRQRERYIYLLQGRPPGPCMDHWDRRVMELMWRDLRGTMFMGSPGPPDRAFIAAARSDVPRLVAEVHRLRTEVARLSHWSEMEDTPEEEGEGK